MARGKAPTRRATFSELIDSRRSRSAQLECSSARGKGQRRGLSGRARWRTVIRQHTRVRQARYPRKKLIRRNESSVQCAAAGGSEAQQQIGDGRDGLTQRSGGSSAAGPQECQLVPPLFIPKASVPAAKQVEELAGAVSERRGGPAPGRGPSAVRFARRIRGPPS